MSFTIAAAILGSFAPIVIFIIWNTPSLAGQTECTLSASSLPSA
jgi:hypothetical protein